MAPVAMSVTISAEAEATSSVSLSMIAAAAAGSLNWMFPSSLPEASARNSVPALMSKPEKLLALVMPERAFAEIEPAIEEQFGRVAHLSAPCRTVPSLHVPWPALFPPYRPAKRPGRRARNR